MPPIDLVGRVTFWEMELPSLERYRQRSPFGKDYSGPPLYLGSRGQSVGGEFRGEELKWLFRF